MAVVSSTQPVPRHPAQRGLLSYCLSAIARTVFWLLMALVFSVIVEWIGMVFWWPEDGIEHSRAMLARELDYLNRDFRNSVLTSDPVEFAGRLVDAVHYWLFEWTGFAEWVAWFERVARPGESAFEIGLRRAYDTISDFLLAAMIMTQVFAVRLAMLALAMPIFLLLALVALVDGLVQRDLRRWGGGRESAFVYHHAKPAVGPLLVLPWILYLGLPFSLHPNFLILPFAALFGLGIAVTTGTFKKYL